MNEDTLVDQVDGLEENKLSMMKHIEILLNERYVLETKVETSREENKGLPEFHSCDIVLQHEYFHV